MHIDSIAGEKMFVKIKESLSEINKNLVVASLQLNEFMLLKLKGRKKEKKNEIMFVSDMKVNLIFSCVTFLSCNYISLEHCRVKWRRWCGILFKIRNHNTKVVIYRLAYIRIYYFDNSS